MGKFRDCGNAAQQPEAAQTDRERAAFVAGSQAWLDNADEQARANFAEIAQASADALEEARAFSEHCSRFASAGADSDRRMQDDADYRLAARWEELEERRKQVVDATSAFHEAQPCDDHTDENGGKSADCDKCMKWDRDTLIGSELQQDLVRIEAQIELLLNMHPSTLPAPADARSAGSAPVNNRGVSSTSAWTVQTDAKGVTGVCLENENSEFEVEDPVGIPFKDPVKQKEVSPPTLRP